MSYTSNNKYLIEHIQKTLVEGGRSEDRFIDSCKAFGLKVERSSFKEDTREHTDLYVDGKRVDVKGIKPCHQHGKIILEIISNTGDQGWCNPDGYPEYLAFDFGSFFLYAKNLDLFNFVSKRCDLDDLAAGWKEALYKGCNRARSGRKDLFTMILLADVLNSCEHKFIPYAKPKDNSDLSWML